MRLGSYVYIGLCVGVMACAPTKPPPPSLVDQKYTFDFEVAGDKAGISQVFGDGESTFVQLQKTERAPYIVARDGKTKRRLGMKEEGRLVRLLSTAPLITMEIGGKKVLIRRGPPGIGQF